jgi:hypothetical protein
LKDGVARHIQRGAINGPDVLRMDMGEGKGIKNEQ